MKKIMTNLGVAIFAYLFLISCGSSTSQEEKAKIIKEYKDSIALVEKAKQDSIANSDFENKKIINIPKKEPILNFKQLYPILKKSLLKYVCESYRIEEKSNRLSAYNKESDSHLSTWSWDLNNDPLIIKDIDNDCVIDYTLELSNEGGGCGGQIAQSERWTLFGSKPDRFIWTHTIPYRSESGKWEKN